MQEPVIYLKSYLGDLERAGRLLESIRRYNRDRLPVVVSVPASDLEAFGERLDAKSATLVRDEDILAPALADGKGAAEDDLARLPPDLRQQAVKCEFWRWAGCELYLVLDSDSYFIRPFGRDDFIFAEGVPYTVMHESKDLLQFAARAGMARVLRDYRDLRRRFRQLFGRTAGRDWDFGPTPVVWSARVWRRLARDWAAPRATNVFAMLGRHPCELLWYGEALLQAPPFPVMPVEPLFKVYHYRQQYEEGVRLGETDAVLADNFLGVVRQSNWDRPPGPPPSSWWRRLAGLRTTHGQGGGR